MTKKKPSENKIKSESKQSENTGKRQRLLARVAGHVASGIIGAPSPAASSAEDIAAIAVEIAEAILQKVGI